ncbi:hypothetical protein [Infirmifilum sp. NZ]|uniref:hypothetical protein n=1 Tax=Infirmifilum sp. NZ TaxID=2926850 RepID=UPI0027A3F5FF|nr:hypothetical protein [Infirmifilum sp. NZ]UNQ72559.1 hypothetical protein MOV14_05395 [Infirmifilum sp. NZ]
MSKKPYPHNTDIKEIILEVLSKHPLVKPEEFVDRVKEALEEKGFFVGLVTAKRVWKVYEDMVKGGDIYDYLGVVQRGGSGDRGENVF